MSLYTTVCSNLQFDNPSPVSVWPWPRGDEFSSLPSQPNFDIPSRTFALSDHGQQFHSRSERIYSTDEMDSQRWNSYKSDHRDENSKQQIDDVVSRWLATECDCVLHHHEVESEVVRERELSRIGRFCRVSTTPVDMSALRR